jgi:hypothetical protein
VVDPPANDPPVVDPPSNDPPVDPPANDPPVVVDPPVVDPPANDPPVVENPPTDNPPTENPPAENPPSNDPPVTNDPPIVNDPPTNDSSGDDPSSTGNDPVPPIVLDPPPVDQPGPPVDTTVGPIDFTGTVFNDANHNGRRGTSEKGLAGRTVYADANGNHRLDAGETSTVTDSNGNFTLSLEPGEYTIRQVTPAGWRATRNWSGRHVTVTADTEQSDVKPISFGSVERSADNWYKEWSRKQAAALKAKTPAIEFSSKAQKTSNRKH